MNSPYSQTPRPTPFANEGIRTSRQASPTNTFMDSRSVVAVSQNAVFSEVSGEAVILNMFDGVYYGLDPVGVSIWKAMQESSSVQAVHEALLEEYDVEPEQCMRDLLALLEQLAHYKLIEVHPPQS